MGESLFRRKCCREPVCKICCKADETIEHCLLLCDWAKKLWFGSSIGIMINERNICRFDNWLWMMLGEGRKGNDFQKALLASICWSIWKGRCNVIYQDMVLEPKKILRNATNLVNEFWVAKGWIKERVLPSFNREGSVWKTPNHGCTKVNIDGSFLSKTGKAGIGIIFRNNNGDLLKFVAEQAKSTSAFMSEALAPRKALDLIKLSGNGTYLIESDCEALVKTTTYVSFGFISRSCNKAADWLAVSGSKGVCLEGCSAQPPPSLAKLLLEDKVRCATTCNVGPCQIRTGIG
ncbi:uncharacterized protein LOC114739365 [Neltuma alba]|uniref:uncharacterized protein LOC114739365 n=1 Tax=Neltuma alba TaxID=207710 RepID=UPI0010A49DAD|nr:uncharacterized protein LOC114739365 [Prosopis alba]